MLKKAHLLASGLLILCLLGAFFAISNGAVGAAVVQPNQPVVLAPLADITQITTGFWHTCALTANGGVKCWGHNNYGQLGDGTTIDRLLPVDVVGLNSNIRAITAGFAYTCALTTADEIKCWGDNRNGQLGDGTTNAALTPVNVVGLVNGIQAVASGGFHTCALLNSGGIKCWGSNAGGQLGDSTTQDRLTPIDVVGLNSNPRAIIAGFSHTCVLTVAGGVKCWGSNSAGEVGDGTTINRTVPTDVTGLDVGVHAVAAGLGYTCAVMNSGAVKCWGDSYEGLLGDGTTIDRLIPVQVVGLVSGVTTIANGFFHTCVVTTSGGAKCWGTSNSAGELGDGTVISHTIPLDVVGLNASISSISVDASHTCSLTTTGHVKCWGSNADGQLGDGTTIARTTPIDVLDNVQAPPTATPTNTPSPTATVTPAPPTATPTPRGDAAEPDNSCDQAKTISLNGVAQTHTFDAAADVDWLRFDAMQNVTYRIEVQVPAGSPADANLELYTDCSQTPTTIWNKTFTPGVRLDFTAPSTGPVFLKLNNTDATVGGAQVVYQIAVQVARTPQSGALIIVAGRLKLSDPLQTNIHNVTDQVYALFQAHGYTNDQIYYLATDATRLGYDAPATKSNLHAAIVNWAADRVSLDKGLTVYMMDHGDTKALYLDAVNQELVNPEELASWLTELETKVPGVKINVIVEACNSGSFLTGADRISKPNRVIITSTSDDAVALASANGAHFSDYLLTALRQGDSLDAGFRAAQNAVRHVSVLQQPWLDSNGNGIPNELDDDTVAAQRSFGSSTLDTDSWPPYIVRAQAPNAITNRHGILEATVRDDKQVRRVWAVIYPPSYKPPQTRNELVSGTALPTVVLQAQGNEEFAADYPGFDEIGPYRIAIYAEDGDGLVSTPVVLKVGARVFLPLVSR